MAEKKSPIEVEFESVLTQAFRSGLGRVPWQEIVEKPEHRRTLGGILAGSSRTLKNLKVESPVEALAGLAQERHPDPPKPNEPHLGFAVAMFATELAGLVWGYTNYGGKRDYTTLTIFEERHGLTNPSKWRQFTAERLRELGFLPPRAA